MPAGLLDLPKRVRALIDATSQTLPAAATAASHGGAHIDQVGRRPEGNGLRAPGAPTRESNPHRLPNPNRFRITAERETDRLRFMKTPSRSSKTVTRGIGVAALLLSAVLLSACTVTKGVQPTPSTTGHAAKPNIVFVLTDDLSMNLVSHMPHVLALQSRARRWRTTTWSTRCAARRGRRSSPASTRTTTACSPTPAADGGYTAYNSNGDQEKSFALACRSAATRPGSWASTSTDTSPRTRCRRAGTTGTSPATATPSSTTP